MERVLRQDAALEAKAGEKKIKPRFSPRQTYKARRKAITLVADNRTPLLNP